MTQARPKLTVAARNTNVSSCLLPTVVVYKNSPFGWRGGIVVKSSGCSSRGPEINSQHPYGSSQLSCNFSSRGSDTQTHASKLPIHINKYWVFFLKEGILYWRHGFCSKWHNSLPQVSERDIRKLKLGFVIFTFKFKLWNSCLNYF